MEERRDIKDLGERVVALEKNVEYLIADRIQSTESRAKMVQDIGGIDVKMGKMSVDSEWTKATVGTLADGQVEIAKHLGRLDTKIEVSKRIEPKTIWLALGVIGTVSGVAVMGTIAAIELLT